MMMTKMDSQSTQMTAEAGKSLMPTKPVFRLLDLPAKIRPNIYRGLLVNNFNGNEVVLPSGHGVDGHLKYNRRVASPLTKAGLEHDHHSRKMTTRCMLLTRGTESWLIGS